VIDAGTVAEALLEPRLTSTPPTPAGAESCTVPVDGEPPVTDVGDRVSEEIVPVPGPGGVNDNVAVVVLADVPVIVAVAGEPTGVVVTEKVPDDAPAGMTIDAGTVAAVLSEDKLTNIPPAGAGEERFTVPVEGDPLTTELGESDIDAIVPCPAPDAVNVSDAVVPFAEVAVMVAVVDEPTAVVATANVPEEAP